jgi:hypothetical protein
MPPNGFNQMGNIPEGYDSLLNSARQQLVKLPNGSYTVAPQFGGSTNINDLYKGIYPSARPQTTSGLKNNYVPTYQVRSDGTPIIPRAPGFSAPSSASTRAEQSGSRTAFTQGTQPAGTVPMPPGARPAVVDRMFAQMGSAQPSGGSGRGRPIPSGLSRPVQMAASPVWDPFNPNTPKYQDRLPPNDGGEAGFLQAFGPGASNPALTAIDQLSGSGRNTAMPFPLMGFNQPRYSEPIDITIRGGSKMLPMPRNRPAPPQVPGAITFKRGDTVSKLAKQRGMTTASFADLFGIANPNKIRAGQTVFRQAPPVPMQQRPMALSRGPTPPVPRPRPMQRTAASQGETFDSVWAEARG